MSHPPLSLLSISFIWLSALSYSFSDFLFLPSSSLLFFLLLVLGVPVSPSGYGPSCLYHCINNERLLVESAAGECPSALPLIAIHSSAYLPPPALMGLSENIQDPWVGLFPAGELPCRETYNWEISGSLPSLRHVYNALANNKGASWAMYAINFRPLQIIPISALFGAASKALCLKLKQEVCWWKYISKYDAHFWSLFWERVLEIIMLWFNRIWQSVVGPVLIMASAVGRREPAQWINYFSPTARLISEAEVARRQSGIWNQLIKAFYLRGFLPIELQEEEVLTVYQMASWYHD